MGLERWARISTIAQFPLGAACLLVGWMSYERQVSASPQPSSSTAAWSSTLTSSSMLPMIVSVMAVSILLSAALNLLAERRRRENISKEIEHALEVVLARKGIAPDRPDLSSTLSLPNSVDLRKANPKFDGEI